jgi:hypothetical protein
MGGVPMKRPESSEYADYFDRYIGKVLDGDIRDTLSAQLDEFLGLLTNVGEEQAGFRYAPGKWSIKELVGHVVDTERIFGTRALAVARGDRTPLPSFDQDAYVEGGNFDVRTMASLSEEFANLRRSHLFLLQSFDEEEWSRRGTAGGNEFTVRAIAWTVAGHLIHHAEVLKERYL